MKHLLLFSVLTFSVCVHSADKPTIEIEVQKLEPNATCDSRWFRFGSLKVESNQLMGTVRVLQDIDNSLMLGTDIRRKGSYFANIKSNTKVCDKLADKRKYWWVQIKPASSIGCPIRKGLYNLSNFGVDEKFGFNGDFQLKLTLERNEVVLCSVVLYFNVKKV